MTRAPELNTNENITYNSKADLWSLGICYYQLLFNIVPFRGDDKERLEQQKLFSGTNLKFPPKEKYSENSKNLLQKILVADPAKRISWEDFFMHPLFTEYEKNN